MKHLLSAEVMSKSVSFLPAWNLILQIKYIEHEQNNNNDVHCGHKINVVYDDETSFQPTFKGKGKNNCLSSTLDRPISYLSYIFLLFQ